LLYENKMGIYIRLTDYKSSELKEKEFFNKNNYFTSFTSDFSKIPGSPIAYWVSEKIFEIYSKGLFLGDTYSPKQGMATTDNERFLRFWHEVEVNKIVFNKNNTEIVDVAKIWYPFEKGGEFRKWYGNNSYIVD